MADPFAPPSEAPRTTRRRDPLPPPSPAPYSAAPSTTSWSSPGADPRPEPRTDHHAEPARPGPFWMLAGVGIGLLCLAHLLRFFVVIDDIPDELVAPGLFAVFGLVALSLGLALAALMQRGLSVPWRIALLLGAGFLAAQGSGWTSFLSLGLFD